MTENQKRINQAEASEAAYDHIESMLENADAFNGLAPLWHGWALREAFIAGAKWQEQQSND